MSHRPPITALPQTASTSSLGLGLFILVNAVLFIRPAEIFPELAGLPIYEVPILACLAVCFPRVASQLTAPALRSSPLTVCVLGLLPAAALSHLTHSMFGVAVESILAFGRLVIYYLLLVAVLDTPARVRTLLCWVAIFILVLAVFALLQYHEIINVSALSVLDQWEIDPATGEALVTPRLRGAGLYHDPNDMASILALGMTAVLAGLGDRRRLLRSPLWLAALGVLTYAMVLTQSRGGFLALLTTVAVLGISTLGVRKGVLLAGLAVPLLLAMAAGRQTDMDVSGGTGQQRIQLWSMGLFALRDAPLFGVGMNSYPDIADGYVAHNSFVGTYVELGLLGGTLFLGACYLALESCYRLGPPRLQLSDPELGRLRPFLLALIAGYFVGLMGLSRSYITPTYLVIGLGCVYTRLAAPADPRLRPRFDGRLIRKLLLVSTLFLAGIYLFVRLFANWQ